MSGNVENIDPETDALTGMFREHDEALAAIQRVRDLTGFLTFNPDAIYSAGRMAQMILKALDGEANV
jgi:hypothetical protein